MRSIILVLTLLMANFADGNSTVDVENLPTSPNALFDILRAWTTAGSAKPDDSHQARRTSGSAAPGDHLLKRIFPGSTEFAGIFRRRTTTESTESTDNSFQNDTDPEWIEPASYIFRIDAKSGSTELADDLSRNRPSTGSAELADSFITRPTPGSPELLARSIFTFPTRTTANLLRDYQRKMLEESARTEEAFWNDSNKLAQKYYSNDPKSVFSLTNKKPTRLNATGVLPPAFPGSFHAGMMNPSLSQDLGKDNRTLIRVAPGMRLFGKRVLGIGNLMAIGSGRSRSTGHVAKFYFNRVYSTTVKVVEGVKQKQERFMAGGSAALSAAFVLVILEVYVGLW